MGMNAAQKILSSHLVSGRMAPGEEIAIRIDQTLTQDATGTMAYLQFEAMGVPRVKTELSVSYVDHNTLQTGFENADDHCFLQSIAAKHGLFFSRPGNGICHQVHLERFGVPGKTLLGSDSHTPTGGGIGMVAIGAGGLDVAVAMAGGPFYMNMPKVVLVKLTGKLGPWVSAKDVILELLRRQSVKGGVGKIMEYGGPGVKTLSVPDRATITNMGAELGATTSLFPSDDITLEFLSAEGRQSAWTRIEADPDASYDEIIEIDLSALEPMVAQPHQPDRVVKVKDIEGLKVNQVLVGSCTNSSYRDLMTLAHMTADEIVPVVDTWAQETLEIGSRPEIGYVEVFENRGAMMGCSNPHPHGQIWATEHIPNIPAAELHRQNEYMQEKGSCLLCDYLALEKSKGERMVCENEHFAVVVPYWATWPFETLLLSKRHTESIPNLSREERVSLADIIRRTTTKYDHLFGISFPYSMGWHQAPTDGAEHKSWHLHAHFFPPLLRSATVKKFMVGFEMLAMPQRDITPESAAARLQELPDEWNQPCNQ
jgi:galactose-1-phosphate uridylyltransferase (family 1)